MFTKLNCKVFTYHKALGFEVDGPGLASSAFLLVPLPEGLGSENAWNVQVIVVKKTDSTYE